MHRFTRLHPYVNAVYFLSVILILIFSANPVFPALSVSSGALFLILAQRRFPKPIALFGWLLTICVITLSNPLFTHRGATPLFFLNQKPFTLEALLYGANSSVMLVGVLLWFSCFQLCFTEDKLLYLFGRFSPKTALLLTTTLRFLPMLRRQAVRIRDVQKAMGLFASDTWTDKLKGALRVCSALLTWALEQAIDTGAAMQARGYGLNGKTEFQQHHFTSTDAAVLVMILTADAVILSAGLQGDLAFSFYPQVTYHPLGFVNCIAFAAFALLTAFPSILIGKEALQWRYYRSKI